MSYMMCSQCGKFFGVIGTVVYPCACQKPIPSGPGKIFDVNGNDFPPYVPVVQQPRDPRGSVHPLDPAYDPPLYWPDPGWVSYRFKFTIADPPRGGLLERIRKIDEVQAVE